MINRTFHVMDRWKFDCLIAIILAVFLDIEVCGFEMRREFHALVRHDLAALKLLIVDSSFNFYLFYLFPLMIC